jgi:protein TonB
LRQVIHFAGVRRFGEAQVLQATIGKEGDVENLQVISGDSMLAAASFEAVKQWKYKPYLVNGEPVEVETQVDVIFTLNP